MNTKTKAASPSQGTLSRLCRRPEAWTRKVARFQSAVSRFCPKDDTMSWRKMNRLTNNPERWITWLVGRRRTQQTARHCVKCRSHEHRHVERTLLARNPSVSGHVHPRVGIDSNTNQYELGRLSRSLAGVTRVDRQFCQRTPRSPGVVRSACMGVLRCSTHASVWCAGVS